jgi:hypothetical protein
VSAARNKQLGDFVGAILGEIFTEARVKALEAGDAPGRCPTKDLERATFFWLTVPTGWKESGKSISLSCYWP